MPLNSDEKSAFDLSDSDSFKKQLNFSIPPKSSFWFFSREFESVLSAKLNERENRQFQAAIDRDNENINRSLEESNFGDKGSQSRFDFRSKQDRSLMFVMSCLKGKNSFWRWTADEESEDVGV